MLAPGDVIEIDVDKPAAGGRMIARHEGQVVLVLGGIPGERVRARVERVEKRLAFASAAEIVRPSADRRAWDCRSAVRRLRLRAHRVPAAGGAQVRGDRGRLPPARPHSPRVSRRRGRLPGIRLPAARAPARRGRPGRLLPRGDAPAVRRGADRPAAPGIPDGDRGGLDRAGRRRRRRRLDRDQRERRGRRACAAPRAVRARLAWRRGARDGCRCRRVDRLHGAFRDRGLLDGRHARRRGSSRRADRRPRHRRRAAPPCRVVLPGQSFSDGGSGVRGDGRGAARRTRARSLRGCRPVLRFAGRGRTGRGSRRSKGTARAAPISCGTPPRTRRSFRPSSGAWRSRCGGARTPAPSSWIRRGPACRGRRSTPSSSSQPRGSSTSRAIRRRWPGTHGGCSTRATASRRCAGSICFRTRRTWKLWGYSTGAEPTERTEETDPASADRL